MSFKRKALIISLILMVFILLMTSLACERPLCIAVENKTSQILTIYVEGVSLGTVEPGKQVKKEFPGGVFLLGNVYTTR